MDLFTEKIFIRLPALREYISREGRENQSRCGAALPLLQTAHCSSTPPRNMMQCVKGTLIPCSNVNVFSSQNKAEGLGALAACDQTTLLGDKACNPRPSEFASRVKYAGGI